MLGASPAHRRRYEDALQGGLLAMDKLGERRPGVDMKASQDAEAERLTMAAAGAMASLLVCLFINDPLSHIYNLFFFSLVLSSLKMGLRHSLVRNTWM